MSNIYKFPGIDTVLHEDDGDEEREIPLVTRIGLGVIGGLLAVVVGAVVMVVFFLRWPLHIVCNLAGGLGFGGALFGWILSRPEVMWTGLAFSLGAFAIRWCYDLLLMWLTSRSD